MSSCPIPSTQSVPETSCSSETSVIDSLICLHSSNVNFVPNFDYEPTADASPAASTGAVETEDGVNLLLTLTTTEEEKEVNQNSMLENEKNAKKKQENQKVVFGPLRNLDASRLELKVYDHYNMSFLNRDGFYYVKSIERLKNQQDLMRSELKLQVESTPHPFSLSSTESFFKRPKILELFRTLLPRKTTDQKAYFTSWLNYLNFETSPIVKAEVVGELANGYSVGVKAKRRIDTCDNWRLATDLRGELSELTQRQYERLVETKANHSIYSFKGKKSAELSHKPPPVDSNQKKDHDRMQPVNKRRRLSSSSATKHKRERFFVVAGPLSLVNNSCDYHANVRPGEWDAAAFGLKYQWQKATVKAYVIMIENELTFYYGTGYASELRCRSCQ